MLVSDCYLTSEEQFVRFIMARTSFKFMMKWHPFCAKSTHGPSWSWSYNSWIYNYLCNHCVSPQKLWVLITLMACC